MPRPSTASAARLVQLPICAFRLMRPSFLMIFMGASLVIPANTTYKPSSLRINGQKPPVAPVKGDVFGNEALSFQLQLRVYHEVSVLKTDEQRYEYINCHPRTGLLNGLA